MLAVAGGAAVVLRIPLCPIAALTGVPCPGCGLGRATLALFSGRFAQALRFHPLVLVALPAGIVGFLHVTRARPATRVAERWFATGAGALLALFIGVWIARFGGAFAGPVPIEMVWAIH